MKNKFHFRITDIKNKIIISLLALVVVGYGMIGTVLPAFTKPAGRGYMGLQGYVDDYVGYVSYVKEGMYGNNFFSIRSIPPPQPPTSAQLLYIYMGKISAIFGIDAPTGYHLFRAIFGLMLVFAIYGFMRVMAGKRGAVWSTVVSILATSVGWYGYVNGKLIYETLASFWFVNNDAQRFTNRPHYLFGAFLFMLISIINLGKDTDGNRKKLTGVFILAFILGTVHPSFSTILGVVAAILVVWRMIRFRSVKKLFNSYLITGLGLLAGVGLSYWSTQQYPYTWILSFEGYVRYQNLGWNRIWADLIALGPAMWLGTVGMVLALVKTKLRDEKKFYLAVWFVIQMAFFFWFYKYLRTERVRYIQSLYFVPMGYFSYYLLGEITQKFKPIVLNILLSILVLSMIPTVVNGTISSIYENTNYSYYQYFIFPTNNMLDAYRFLDRHTPRESTVIAAYEAANNIIMYSHNYVIGNKEGWPAEEGARMEKEKEQFFAGSWDEATTIKYLKSRNISYVYQGYQELPGFLKYPLYEKVYQNPEVAIYKVKL